MDTHIEFKRKIDSARNILVGAVPSPAGQIDQITYALIYKFMSDIDDKSARLPGGRRQYFVNEFEKYDWHNLMRLDGQDKLNRYRDALTMMSKNPHLPEIFRSIYQNAFLPYNDPRTLNLFLKEIDGFVHTKSDAIGDAYEYLLSITGAQGDVGQFRTPRHIIKFIIDIVQPQKDETVLDPACGTAGFLIAAYNYVRMQHDGVDEEGNQNGEQRLTADERSKLHNNYFGFDIDPTMVRTATVNMYLHGFSTPNIEIHDTLTSDEHWNNRYDVILANPPFMTPKGGIQPHGKFGVKANRAEVLFVDYIASHLKANGRAGIIVPEGIIFQSGNAYKELRKSLVENSLYAVVSLPSGVFNPYAGVKTSILVLDKELAAKNDEVLFVKIENDGYSLGAQRRPIDGSQFPKALQTIERFKKGEELQTEFAHAVKREQIAESGDYNLSGERYKVHAAIDSEWPHMNLSEVISLESGSRQKGGALDSGIPSIGGEQVLADGNIRFGKMKYISQEHFTSMRSGVLKQGDVLVVKDGATTGKTGYWNRDMAAAVNEHVYIMRANREKIDPFYLYSVVRSNQFQAILGRYIKGIIGGISREILEIEIPVPPIAVQREIVAELDGYQKVIDAAQTIVKTYKPTIKINPEWELIKIGEAFKTSSGGTPSKSKPEYYANGTIPWLGSGEVAQGIIKESKNTISELGLKESSAKIFPVDSVLIAMYGATVGQVGILKFESSTNQAVCAILPNNDIAVPEFIYSIMKLYKDDLIRLSTGGAQPNISQQIIRNFQIPLPPTEIQREIVAELEAEQELIDANKKLIETYQKKIKQKISEIWGE
jgi:type I restriction enzyme M protein